MIVFPIKGKQSLASFLGGGGKYIFNGSMQIKIEVIFSLDYDGGK